MTQQCSDKEKFNPDFIEQVQQIDVSLPDEEYGTALYQVLMAQDDPYTRGFLEGLVSSHRSHGVPYTGIGIALIAIANAWKALEETLENEPGRS